MIRAKKLSLVTARRTLRALYAQTQGYPYAAHLAAATATATDHNWTDPAKNQSTLTAFGQVNAAQVFPGAVMELASPAELGGETVDLAGAESVIPFGLCANFVGGDLDEIGDLGEVGVWRGRGSVWIVLAPLFVADEDIDPGMYLNADELGVLGNANTAAQTGNVGQVLDVLGASAIILDLQVP